MEKEKLFTEFPPVSTEKWEEIIKADLKGADYEKKLVWNTNEGIKIKPYYRSEDLAQISHHKTLPGQFPFVRGNAPDGNNWEIRQDVKVETIAQANAEALEAVEKGATALCFNACDQIKSAKDFSALLEGIHFGCIGLYFQTCTNAGEIFNFLIEESKKRGYDMNLMNGSINFNPAGVLTTSGNWIQSRERDFEIAKNLLVASKEQIPAFRVLSATGCHFKNAGASIVQELGYTLAVAVEYLDELTNAGLKVGDVAPRIQFNFATGANYFMEIAKIRAFRLLWAQAVKAYGVADEKVMKAHINCTSGRWNKTLYDPYVNMLRSTTESMSAAIGGADSISVRNFDTVYKKASGFGNRMARNTQIILKEEAYMDRVADPAAGSYYIESLTDSLIGEAWKLFLKVQEEGGFSAAFVNGSIQNDIEAVAKKRLNDVSSRKDTILGTNQYPNGTEQMLANIDIAVYEEKQKISANPIAKPLVKLRASEAFENLRLKTEKSGKRPKVFMLTIGNLAMRLARSQFSANFFSVAGFETIDNNGFKTIEEGVNTAFAAKADIIVLCSSDEEYETFAPEAFDKIGNKAILVVAGAPACMEDLKAKGIKNFINVKSNVIETLSEYQKLLNI